MRCEDEAVKMMARLVTRFSRRFFGPEYTALWNRRIRLPLSRNDVMQALGTPEKQIAIMPVFAQWLQAAHGGALGSSLTAGDFLVHHAIALGLHVTSLVLLKSALRIEANARQSGIRLRVSMRRTRTWRNLRYLGVR